MNKILFLIFIIIINFSGCKKEELLINKKAPSFSLIDIDEKVHRLSEYKDKIVILRFWQKDCYECLKGMPELNDINLKYQKELVVIGINIGNSMKYIKQFSRELNIKYPMLGDELKIATEKYNVKVSPTTFIIDKEGILRKQILGKIDKNILFEIIENYI